jgi:peptidoglycan/xylan/chitin deacetylase (PgdA/CDA1 family)
LKRAGHYLGAHSDKHLLYCDWSRRDSLLVTRKQFIDDLRANYAEMQRYGIRKKDTKYFLPPYEWYNDTISAWTQQEGLRLINFTPGTISHADYTTPDMPNYRSAEAIYRSVTNQEKQQGLNGFILLIHIGTAPERTDKFYARLEALIAHLKKEGYVFVRVDDLLE